MDAVLFPLDTIKTRLQSKGGLKTMRRLYSGIPFTLLGSAPSGKLCESEKDSKKFIFSVAALFFTAYEQGKTHLPFNHQTTIFLSSMAGETVYIEMHHLIFTFVFLVGLLRASAS